MQKSLLSCALCRHLLRALEPDPFRSRSHSVQTRPFSTSAPAPPLGTAPACRPSLESSLSKLQKTLSPGRYGFQVGWPLGNNRKIRNAYLVLKNKYLTIWEGFPSGGPCGHEEVDSPDSCPVGRGDWCPQHPSGSYAGQELGSALTSVLLVSIQD